LDHAVNGFGANQREHHVIAGISRVGKPVEKDASEGPAEGPRKPRMRGECVGRACEGGVVGLAAQPGKDAFVEGFGSFRSDVAILPSRSGYEVRQYGTVGEVVNGCQDLLRAAQVVY
jgi:hypothetical protein